MNSMFVGQGINEAYYKALERLIRDPDYISSPRGLKIRELIDTTIEIKNPRERIITYAHRDLSLKYLAGELAFYFSGSRSLKFISHYSSFWNKISDDGKTVNSCYGYKLFVKRTKGHSQFEYAREQLYNDGDTRKAVMIIYTPENTDDRTHDNPCTMYLHFFIRNQKLSLHAYMRSSDIWFGVSYDIPFFTVLQEFMLVHLKNTDSPGCDNLKLGSFYLHSGSLHLYDRNCKQAKRLVQEPIGYYHNMNTHSPPITLGTLDAMPNFLSYEEHTRLGKHHCPKMDDPFLDSLVNFLQEEKK